MSADKRATVDRFLMHGETHVLVDPRQPGVAVPERFRAQEQLILKISYKYSPPDLEVSDWGIRITLQFGRELHRCEIPWSALYAAHALTGDVEAWPAPAEPPVIERRRGHLGLVH
jgi:stringent starvation protein B